MAHQLSDRRLTTKQTRAVEALMRESTIDAAAAAAGVHRSTLFRWLKDETFCIELRRASDDAISTTARRLATLSGKAADVLEDLLEGAEKEEVKLRAADTVLSHMLKVFEVHDIERRLAALEGAGADHDQGATPDEDSEATIVQTGGPGRSET
jgi:hypothetical protein